MEADGVSQIATIFSVVLIGFPVLVITGVIWIARRNKEKK